MSIPEKDNSLVASQDEKGVQDSTDSGAYEVSQTPSGAPTFAMYKKLAELAREREAHGLDHEEVKDPSLTIKEAELINARRALRVANWASVFFLITTDILGPFNAPFAFSQVGYVPGTILYVVMGVAACYTGLILWYLYCHLDSDRYPIKQYGDLAERIFGTWFRRLCIVLQSLQLIINVGTICLGNAQALEQIVIGPHGTSATLCFSIAILIWALVGMVIGQIRTLKNYGWLANSAVWFNLLIIFISMGAIAHSAPNYAAAKAAYGIDPGPALKAAFVSLPLFSKVNGIMNMVFAYGGAMIFPEFMAEMRRPMDFWKGMVCAQTLIFVAYMMYGLFVYSFQGQFTLPLAFQGVTQYSFQTVGNVFALISGIIAAGLYGNIGIKVAYISIIEDWIRGPPLMSRKGRVIWTFMVLVYWALAFIIGSAIPQVQTISGLVAAVCIMQFTYTFPPLFLVGYQMVGDAAINDPGDTWKNWSRWRRGFFQGRWLWKSFNTILFLGSLSMACLGMYGSGKAIQATFAAGGSATSFGCGAPV